MCISLVALKPQGVSDLKALCGNKRHGAVSPKAKAGQEAQGCPCDDVEDSPCISRHNGRISEFPFTGGITWRRQHELYHFVMQMRLSHILKVIHGKKKAGICSERVRGEGMWESVSVMRKKLEMRSDWVMSTWSIYGEKFLKRRMDELVQFSCRYKHERSAIYFIS